MLSVGLSHAIVCQGSTNQIILGRAVLFPFWDPIHMADITQADGLRGFSPNGVGFLLS